MPESKNHEFVLFLFWGTNLHSLSSASDSRSSVKSLVRVYARLNGLDEIFLRSEELVRWSFADWIILLDYLGKDGKGGINTVELIAENFAQVLSRIENQIRDM